MDNFFVTQFFDWGWHWEGRLLTLGNRLLRRSGSSWTLRRLATPFTHTTTVEQRINLWHLVSQPLAYGVPGDVVELGCFDGKTAVIFARAIAQLAPGRSLHVYDHFHAGFHLGAADIEQELLANFQRTGTPSPAIHRGDFLDTIPAHLPEAVAFAHIDCGYDGDVAKQQNTIIHLLEHLYPRMPRGAVGVLMDFYDPALCRGRNFNPGIRPAAADFFADKPEKIISLWGGDYAHAFFRKT